MKALLVEAKRVPRDQYIVSEFEKRTGCPENGSLIFKDPKLNYTDIPSPQVGPEDVLIRVEACGICGADLNFLRTDAEGYTLQAGRCNLPLAIGHEFSGEVVEVGGEVRDFKKGDLVVAETNLWCGECLACREGMFNQCLYELELGFSAPGGFEEYVAVDARHCWKINSLVETYGSREKALEAGALIEPTAVAYNAIFIRADGLRPGDSVVVHGAGPVGLAAVALCKAAGAGRVISFQPSKVRRKLARTMGADYVFSPYELKDNGSSVWETILELTEGLGADMHVEASGHPEVFQEIEQSLAVRARVAQIGESGSPVSIHSFAYQVKAANICGSSGTAGHGIWPRIIRLMNSRIVDMTPIVTSRFPLCEATKAFEKAFRKEDGKIVVKP